MKIILPLLIIFLSAACTPHKFDVDYRTSSPTYQLKVSTVEKNNESKIKDHQRKRREVALANIELEKKNVIPNGVQIEVDDLPNHFIIRNGMNEDLFIEFERSSMVRGNKSFRVVSGKTRKLDQNRTVPDQIIASGTQAEVSFYSDEGSSFLSTVYDKLNISFSVGNKRYKIEKFRELSANPPDLEKKPETYLGRVSYLSTTEKHLCGWTFILYGGYCWFIGDADESDFEAARQIASSRYGVPVDELELSEVDD
jgi:hypothetical protein